MEPMGTVNVHQVKSVTGVAGLEPGDCFLHKHPEVLHLLVVVVVSQKRLNPAPEQLPKPLKMFCLC